VRLYRSVENINHCPWTPTAKQRAFLLLIRRDALYGGAARGGKTVAQLMAACQYTCVPGYRAIIIRKALSDLELPGGLIDLAREWFTGHAEWNGKTYTWTFEAGATESSISFGYLNNPGDEYRYKGMEVQYYGLEEATEIEDRDQAHYIESRLTLPEQAVRLEACECHGWTLADVPLRFRLTSNPGGIGSEWVKHEYVDPAMRGLPGIFLPATVFDNEHVNSSAYVESLRNLSAIERARLLEGNWKVTEAGKMFDRRKFNMVNFRDVPWDKISVVRRWDLASTKEKKGKNPDWTAGSLVGLHREDGSWWIIDVRRIREEPTQAEDFMYAAHVWDDSLMDDWLVPIRVEQGLAGDSSWAINSLSTGRFNGVDFDGVKPKGDKKERATPVSTAAGRGRVNVVIDTTSPAGHEWNDDLFTEMELFPDGSHDDMVDTISGAVYDLSSGAVAGGSTGGGAEGLPDEYESEFDVEEMQSLRLGR